MADDPHAPEPAPEPTPGPAPSDPARERRIRRRFRRRRMARRWLSWRWVAVIVALAAVCGGGVWLLGFSTQLQVHHVRVEGNDHLSTADIRRATGIENGEQLVRVDIDRARDRVAAMAAVESVDVTREWPDQVRVEVRERTAVAVVEAAGSWRGLDASGVVFRTYGKPPAGLPKVQASTRAGAEAMGEAAAVAGALSSDMVGRIDHIEVETIDTITLVLRNGKVVLWGSSEESDLKAEVLERLLTSFPADRYDVSVPGSPTAA